MNAEGKMEQDHFIFLTIIFSHKFLCPCLTQQMTFPVTELADSEVQYYGFLLPAGLADWSNRLLIQYLIFSNGWSFSFTIFYLQAIKKPPFFNDFCSSVNQ